MIVAALATGAATAIGAAIPLAAGAVPRRKVSGLRWSDAPVTRLGGLGDGYKMSWAADGAQFVVVNDGPGWADPPDAFYNSRLWTMRGGPQHPAFASVLNYPDLNMSTRPESAPRYHGHGILAVGQHIYQFLSTLDRAEDRPRRWTGAKLIWSADNGRTWQDREGTAPVRFEDWADQSRETLAFFDEPDGCFSLLSILQMGRGYSANRDGFVYIYGLNGNVDGRMNQLVLLRTPVAAVHRRSQYEFFTGRDARGRAIWSRDIARRAVVHTFPQGWVNSVNLFPGDLVVESWLPSVAYNEALGLYMMASAGIGVAPDTTEFGKPSYFGFWVSETPWGPWRQVHEDTAWTPGGDLSSCAYAPQIAPAWIAPDGKSLWLVWADAKGIREFGRDEAMLTAALEKAASPAENSRIQAAFLKRYMPAYAMNAQRIDLTFA